MKTWRLQNCHLTSSRVTELGNSRAGLRGSLCPKLILFNSQQRENTTCWVTTTCQALREVLHTLFNWSLNNDSEVFFLHGKEIVAGGGQDLQALLLPLDHMASGACDTHSLSHPAGPSALLLTQPTVHLQGRWAKEVTSYKKTCFDALNFRAHLNFHLQTCERYSTSHLHFWAPLKRARSFGVSPTSIILAPAKSCMMRPEVTMGEIPSSINVPWRKGKAKHSQDELAKATHY